MRQARRTMADVISAGGGRVGSCARRPCDGAMHEYRRGERRVTLAGVHMVKSVCKRRGRERRGKRGEIKGARWNVWSVESEGGGCCVGRCKVKERKRENS